MDHNHSCQCEHTEVKYCSHCYTVYCLGCNQEWTAKSNYGYWYSPNWYNSPISVPSLGLGPSSGGTTSSGGGINRGVEFIGNTSTCQSHKG